MSPDVLKVYLEHADEIRARRSTKGWGRRGIAKRYGLTPWQARELLDRIAKEDAGHIPKIEPTVAAQPKVSVEHHESGHATATGSVASLEDLISVAKIDTEKWRVASWQARSWDAAVGDGRVRTMHYIRAALERRRLANDLQPVVHHDLPERGWKVARSPSSLERVLVIPDSQVGHRWQRRNGRDVLVPMHDRRAMAVVWEVARRAQADTIVLLGDMLDLTELTLKYPKPLEVLGTAQPSILELAWWLRDLREKCPRARIVYVEGNHEQRLARMVTDKANVLQDLQGVSDKLPALSIERLLDLEGLAIEYVGPFGADTWLWPDTRTPVRVHHGQIVRSKGGQTVSAQLAKEQTSIIGGHIHRVECAYATDHGPQGRVTRIAMSPGCLCRVDSQLEGGVPGYGTRPDWQQGWGWLARDHDADALYGAAELVVDGVTVYHGEKLEAPPESDLLEVLRPATGLRSLDGIKATEV